ncbi:MAG: enoyl-CoA hydratase/isomerase family protein, partial [Bdellovibrionota bacterium]
MMNECSEKIKIDCVVSDIYHHNGFVIFNIPEKMNPLSEDVVEQFAMNFEKLERDPSVKRIFILGRGKAFVAGADIKFFVDAMDRGDIDRIYRFTTYGHDVLNKVSACKKPAIAYLNGLTLGGGLELALACHRRVASPKALLAFPETGIGIYPGLGGTQRAPRLIGKGLAKFMIATGQFVDAQMALKYGLVDMLAGPF